MFYLNNYLLDNWWEGVGNDGDCNEEGEKEDDHCWTDLLDILDNFNIDFETTFPLFMYIESYAFINLFFIVKGIISLSGTAARHYGIQLHDFKVVTLLLLIHFLTQRQFYFCLLVQ